MPDTTQAPAREIGEMPMRTRHCNWLNALHEYATVAVRRWEGGDALGTTDCCPEVGQEPGDRPLG